jgi:hypothetical protein
MTRAVQAAVTLVVQAAMTRAVQAAVTLVVQAAMTRAVQAAVTLVVQAAMNRAVRAAVTLVVRAVVTLGEVSTAQQTQMDSRLVKPKLQMAYQQSAILTLMMF